MIRLICWNEELAKQRQAQLQAAGLTVDASRLQTQGFVSHFKAAAPEAVLIDLDRLPSHGREVASALRTSKSTRFIPIVFAGGPAEKVAAIRKELPDATFTDWAGAAAAVKRAMKTTPVDPVLPTPHMERFAGSPLPKKLGIKPNMKIALLGAPDGFLEQLGDLPEGTEAGSRLTAKTELALWFVRSRRELAAAVEQLAARLPEKASAWIIHPKQSGKYKPDFNQNHVREAGLGAGLVDYKVCAVDAEWSGLKFARRK